MTSAERERDPGQDRPAPFAVTDPKAGVRIAACLALGLVVVAVLVAAGLGVIAAEGGWDAAAVLYLGWTWAQVGPADAGRTAALAVREDASRRISDLVLLLASVASLAGVGDLILLGSASGDPVPRGPAVALAITSVILSWAVVHTLFMLRYAWLYYVGGDGGIGFNQDEPPRYLDFAYLAFTIGMTFQVSDTDLQTSAIRATALRHALLSYLFGAVIIAVTINLVVEGSDLVGREF